MYQLDFFHEILLNRIPKANLYVSFLSQNVIYELDIRDPWLCGINHALNNRFQLFDFLFIFLKNIR